MKLGIVGAGLIVHTLLEFIEQLPIELTAICATPNEIDKLNDLKDRYGFSYAYTDYEEMLKNEKIDTIYIEENKSSHFHAVKDSFRIYKVLLSGSSIIRFVGVSLLCFLLDAALYYGILLAFTESSMSDQIQVLISRIVSRTTSSLCNYFMNRHWVFNAKNTHLAFPKYVLLVATILGVSYGIDLLAMSVGISKWILYIPVQLIVYPVSYLLQRAFVFRSQSDVRS